MFMCVFKPENEKLKLFLLINGIGNLKKFSLPFFALISISLPPG